MAGGLAPTSIQMLALTTRDGFSITPHTDDTMITVYDPSISIEFGEFTVTYETNTTLDTLLLGLSNSGVLNDGKIIRGGVTTQYSFLVGQSTKTGTYGEIEKATRVFYVDSKWV